MKYLAMPLVAVLGWATLAGAALFLPPRPPALATDPAPVIAAVADVACPPPGRRTASSCHHREVADLVRSRNVDAILMPGDLQYNRGELANFNASFDEAYGDMLGKILPAPGNHEYLTPNAAGYGTYFTQPRPYRYVSSIGTWRVLSLDSNCGKIGGCGATSSQGVWLKQHTKDLPVCTVAFWHHPRWNSGEHGDATNMGWTWKRLFRKNVDLVLSGHEHSYQRFKPLKFDGTVKRRRGIVEIVSGAGGKSHYNTGGTDPRTKYRNTTDYGATFITLDDGRFSWEFVTEDGVMKDSGSRKCH